jgi:hypothetical protein
MSSIWQASAIPSATIVLVMPRPCKRTTKKRLRMKSRCSTPRCEVHYLQLFAVIRAYSDHVDTNQYGASSSKRRSANLSKKYWQAMERGDYDWFHMAMDCWPDRVKEKCRKKKSYAIAHGLDG